VADASAEPYVRLSVKVIQGKDIMFDSQIDIPANKIAAQVAEKMAERWLSMMQTALELIRAGQEEVK
jgi:hypothetical protein